MLITMLRLLCMLCNGEKFEALMTIRDGCEVLENIFMTDLSLDERCDATIDLNRNIDSCRKRCAEQSASVRDKGNKYIRYY